MITRLALAAAAAALAAVVATGTATAASRSCPTDNPPNELVVAGGSPQTVQLGQAFGSRLSVSLANTNGCSVTGQLAGVSVDFTAPAGGASGVFAGSGTNRVTVGTDAQGTATAPAFTANGIAGSYSVFASSDYGSARLYLANTATGLAASVVAGTGAGQQATVGSTYAQPLQARVTDANGSPVAGVSVAFAVAAGSTGAGGSFLGGGAQASALTGGDGVATSPLLVANASPGRFAATAAVAGVSTVAVFPLDNHAAVNALSAGAGGVATVETRFPQPLTARLLDAGGQPIEGATVTFSLGSGSAGGAGGPGASFLGGAGQATALTDANGVATSPALVANATPGRFVATASAAGATVATVPLRNLAARLSARTAAQAAPVDGRYRKRLVAHVADAHGRPVGGAAITFAIGKSDAGATASFPDGTSQAVVTTDAKGDAVSPALRASATAGEFRVTAEGSGATISFRLRNVAGTPYALAAGAASGESTAPRTAFPVRLAVTVTDNKGNPVAGAVVTFTAPARGVTGRFGHERRARVRTNANGIAVAPRLVAGAARGGFAVVARARGSRSAAAFALVVAGP